VKLTINIETIPHSEHRYSTVGDWFFDDAGVLQIRVSKMSDPRFSLCVALHEAIESVLCKEMGVTQATADDFDMKYEKEREAGERDDGDEPGDDHAAPYHAQHVTASICERAIAQTLGIDWNEYGKEIEGL
jgi:hypothetical protein